MNRKDRNNSNAVSLAANEFSTRESVAVLAAICPVVCLGPGGSFVRSLCADDAHLGELVEGSASPSSHRGTCDTCGAEVSRSAVGSSVDGPVGVLQAAHEVARELVVSAASTAAQASEVCRAALARIVGILATADGIFERQQMTVFRLAHTAASTAAAFRDVAQPTPAIAGFGNLAGLDGETEGLASERKGLAQRTSRTSRSARKVSDSAGVVTNRTGGSNGSSGTNSRRSIGSQATDGGRFAHGRAVENAGLAAGREVIHGNESDSETTSHSAAHSRLASAQGLFADDAGTGGRDWREQSDRLRARRSAHQKERPGARAQQGTLFVDR
jgi:hypothetical protein